MIHRRHTAARPDGNIAICSDMPSVERDTRQCVHCGKHWTVQLGSGKRRGFCQWHMGPICGSPFCDNCQRKEPGTQIQTTEEINVLHEKHRRQQKIAAMREALKGGIIIP